MKRLTSIKGSHIAQKAPTWPTLKRALPEMGSPLSKMEEIKLKQLVSAFWLVLDTWWVTKKQMEALFSAERTKKDKKTDVACRHSAAFSQALMAPL